MTDRLPEKVVAERVKRLYRLAGCFVCSFQQPRRTMQTPGIPDLRIYYQGPWKDDTGTEHEGVAWWHEVKAEDGRQSSAQEEFQQRAEACGERYVIGGLEAANDILVELGIKEPGWVYF